MKFFKILDVIKMKFPVSLCYRVGTMAIIQILNEGRDFYIRPNM